MHVVERVVEAPAPAARPATNAVPQHAQWPPLLRELASQLDGDQIYRRDLPDITTALDLLLVAFRRRTRRRSF